MAAHRREPEDNLTLRVILIHSVRNSLAIASDIKKTSRIILLWARVI